ncbi:MAG: DUF4492 domain-containing protein [Muribaculaceae bacterium]|nr:DUF4492 domain-containing protein [Muribaculaceae bacterium]MDE6135053.1 DUF4492 domain-containing protein [Muribaculaceae bacterium]
MASSDNFIRRAAALYTDGFREMTVGRKLWALIIIKLIIFFAILKLFFFPDILASSYDSDSQRADAVRAALTERQ